MTFACSLYLYHVNETDENDIRYSNRNDDFVHLRFTIRVYKLRAFKICSFFFCSHIYGRRFSQNLGSESTVFILVI